MAKKHRFLPFQQAKFLVREEGIKSRRQYHRFKSIYGYAELPWKPNVIYSRERIGECGWSGWADFLGTNNVFPAKKRWRSFNAAWLWAQQCPARSKEEWLQLDIPEDIPRLPCMTWGKGGGGLFPGYKAWLGVSKKPLKFVESVKAAEKARNTSNKIMFIAQDEYTGTYICQEAADVEQAIRWCRKRGLTPYKAVRISNATDAWIPDWRDIVLRYSRQIGLNEFSISNIGELSFELTTTFDCC